MSVQSTAARPAGKSVGAAGVGILLTLATFVAVFVTFLIAPLVALLLGYLVYTVMRSRGGDTEPSGPAGSSASSSQSASGFGAGTQ